MTTSQTLTVDKGFEARPYVARVLGADARYGIRREFLHAVRRDLSRSGATGTIEYLITEPGIYEIGNSRGWSIGDLQGYNGSRQRSGAREYIQVRSDGTTLLDDAAAALKAL